MGLQAAFELQLGQASPLDGFDDLVWQNLRAGSKSPRHPWNTGCLITGGSIDASREPAVDFENSAASPTGRMVVVRHVNQSDRRLELHTDVRSGKIRELEHQPAIAWMFWDPATKIQLRLRGKGTLVDDESETDAIWQTVSLRSRSAYLSRSEPGMPVATVSPPSTDDRRESEAGSERGRTHFRVVRTTIESVDWLYLRREGHVRCGLRYDDSGRCIDANWLVP